MRAKRSNGRSAPGVAPPPRSGLAAARRAGRRRANHRCRRGGCRSGGKAAGTRSGRRLSGARPVAAGAVAVSVPASAMVVLRNSTVVPASPAAHDTRRRRRRRPPFDLLDSSSEFISLEPSSLSSRHTWTRSVAASAAARAAGPRRTRRTGEAVSTGRRGQSVVGRRPRLDGASAGLWAGGGRQERRGRRAVGVRAARAGRKPSGHVWSCWESRAPAQKRRRSVSQGGKNRVKTNYFGEVPVAAVGCIAAYVAAAAAGVASGSLSSRPGRTASSATLFWSPCR